MCCSSAWPATATSCAPAASSEQRRSLPAPGEDRRYGVVPYRADDGAGDAGEPPHPIAGKDIGGDADIADGAHGADEIKGNEAAQQPPALEALVAIGEEV